PAAPERWKHYGTEVPMMPPQIQQVSKLLDPPTGSTRRKPDLLLMSIGVNDVGFSDLLFQLATKRCKEKCFAEFRRLRSQGAADCDNNSREARLRLPFQCLEERLARLREAIDEKIAPQRAYLLEYIDPLHDERNQLCTNNAQHTKQLLAGVLGPLLGHLFRIE